MCLVSSTKSLIQKLRDLGWDTLLGKVKSFCNSQLEYELQHYYFDVPKDVKFQSLSTICQKLAKTSKSICYPLVDSLLQLVLTLRVSIATKERVFLAMKIIKTRLHNKMKYVFLTNYMIVYIEKRDCLEIYHICDN
ncbi:hypothetical protein CR513_10608, partial [Mucuna pruriens]